MIYVVYFSDLGTPATGLSPVIDIHLKVSDGLSAGASPAVSEIGGGFYKFTANASEAIVCRVNGGGALTDPDKYKVLQITLEDDNLDQAISTTESNIRGADSDTLETLSDQLDDVPTVAEFEARTLPSADYVVVGDTIAGVTTVGSVTGAVGSVTAGVTLADDAITAAKFDESTAYPIKSADTGATQIARTGADADTLETLSDQIDGVPTNAEFEARTLVAADYLVAGDTLARVTLVDTCTANTDMRGTNSAALASVCTEARLAELDAANLPADIADIPTVAEFNARTLPSADYVVTTDTIAGVTLCATCTTNTDMVAPAPSAATVADAVWDEAIAGHLGAGSTGAALNGAGAAGDPWATTIPGAYGAGTAGKIVGTNLDAPVSVVDTVVDAIKLKTDNLPTDPADQSEVEDAIAAATSTIVYG